MSNELPLDDKPPFVPITDAPTLTLLDRFGQLGGDIDDLEALKLPMPGVALCISTLKAKQQQMKCVMITKFYLLAAKAGVNFSKWCVGGLQSEKSGFSVKLEAISAIDKDIEDNS